MLLTITLCLKKLNLTINASTSSSTSTSTSTPLLQLLRLSQQVCPRRRILAICMPLLTHGLEHAKHLQEANVSKITQQDISHILNRITRESRSRNHININCLHLTMDIQSQGIHIMWPRPRPTLGKAMDARIALLEVHKTTRQ